MIPDYFKNSILNFSTQEYVDKNGITQKSGSKTTLVVPDYKSIDFKKIKILLNMCPTSWFSWIKVANHTNLEKLSQDLYGSPNYWDIILLINGRMPLFEFPYDYDVVESIVDNMTDNYIKRVYKRSVSDKTRERIWQMFSDKVANDNERFRYLKVIGKTYLYNFIQKCHEFELLNE